MSKIHDFKDNLDVFLIHIESIKNTIPMTELLIEPYHQKTIRDFGDFLKTDVQKIIKENGHESFLIQPDSSELFKNKMNQAIVSHISMNIISKSLFVSLVSQYDAFTNRLLKCIFAFIPELLKNSEKSISFSQLMEMISIEDLREIMIEKEIETVLRKNHTEQFDYLEKISNIKLRQDLSIWPIFIELTERRNLFVHCDGIISNQYLKICKQSKCNTNGISVGNKVTINTEYIINAYKCLYEISVKLTHTLWRKLFPNKLKDADYYLNNICFNLIKNKELELADILLDFACNQKKHYDDASKSLFIINASLSKYLQNKNEESINILSKKDWSSCSDKFKMAYAILTNDKNAIYSLMRKIGTNGEISKTTYKWEPLFSIIQNDQGFKDIFKEIFLEEYSILEIPPSPIQELLENKTGNKSKKRKVKNNVNILNN